uniref:Sodium-dependent transporter n=1 Tax=Trichobilharzia regenti TaxID=157069 RepID=A0AA85JXM4_TRIRE|nr:unnamed protein product [Trichobilharzia regenti]
MSLASVTKITIHSGNGETDIKNQKDFDVWESNESKAVEDNEGSTFHSSFGIILTCLGSVVGFGNIWRFPRILATYSYDKGSLTFYLVWFFVLYLWSVPIVIVEYTLGRFTRNSIVGSFHKFFGDKFAWVGGWVVSVTFFLSCYYPVIIGWCLYYSYMSCFVGLPKSEIESKKRFNDYAMDSYWPVLTQCMSVCIAAVCIYGGIKWIEKVNNILVPFLLLIVTFTFGWSLTRRYAEVGIKFLFTPTWSSLKDPAMWIAAASQNAFDTGAGIGALATFAAFMSRERGAVRYGTIIPMLNNLVSFISSIAVFSTVFSTLIQTTPTITRLGIVKLMQSTGPGSTGLTFIWFPVLFESLGVIGRVLCTLFFICLTVAGLSTTISDLQVYTMVLDDTGLNHKISVAVALTANISVGLLSALNIKVLTNQDDVWGFGLLVSGILMATLVIKYGPMKYRRHIVNEFGIGDWNLPKVWVFFIIILVPCQGVILIIWWMYDMTANDPHWYMLTYKSVTTLLIEWSVLLTTLIVLNVLALWRKWSIFPIAQKFGNNPYDLDSCVNYSDV